MKRFQLCLSLALLTSCFATTRALGSSLPASYGRVEETTGWQTCGSCGDSGGGGPRASYEMSRGIVSPSTDGSSSRFSISGPGFANGYWYLYHSSPTTGISYLSYEFEIYVPSGYGNAPQAIEFECQHRLRGWVYNFAWQADYSRNEWRFFDYAHSRWIYSGVPLQRFSTGKWHHVVVEFHESTSGHLVYHDTLTIDGVRHAVGKTTAAKYDGDFTDRFSNAFQLDLNDRGTPYHVYVDDMKITMH